MASAEARGLNASSEKVSGPAIVVRNSHGDPVVLVVDLGPNTQAIYCVHDDEFAAQLQRYGVDQTAIVNDVHL